MSEASRCICEVCRGHIANAELRPVSGGEIRTMLRKHRLTIRTVAERFDITMKRVRESRIKGGTWDWPLIVAVMVRERNSLPPIARTP